MDIVSHSLTMQAQGTNRQGAMEKHSILVIAQRFSDNSVNYIHILTAFTPFENNSTTKIINRQTGTLWTTDKVKTNHMKPNGVMILLEQYDQCKADREKSGRGSRE